MNPGRVFVFILFLLASQLVHSQDIGQMQMFELKGTTKTNKKGKVKQMGDMELTITNVGEFQFVKLRKVSNDPAGKPYLNGKLLEMSESEGLPIYKLYDAALYGGSSKEKMDLNVGPYQLVIYKKDKPFLKLDYTEIINHGSRDVEIRKETIQRVEVVRETEYRYGNK